MTNVECSSENGVTPNFNKAHEPEQSEKSSNLSSKPHVDTPISNVMDSPHNNVTDVECSSENGVTPNSKRKRSHLLNIQKCRQRLAAGHRLTPFSDEV